MPRKNQSWDNVKDRKMSVRVPEAQFLDIQHLCIDHEISIQEFLRRAVNAENKLLDGLLQKKKGQRRLPTNTPPGKSVDSSGDGTMKGAAA
jgi:hypothetical protein